MNKIFYYLLPLDMFLILPFTFSFLSYSPAIPMLFHYLILGISIFLSNKFYSLSRKFLFIALPIIIFWHLPWFFDYATSVYFIWIIDVISMTISGVLIGSSISKFSINFLVFLFFLWMIGDSLLSYMWIIGFSLYSSPYSIYPRYELPAAGSIVFVVMDILGVYILLKLFFAKIFTN
ncbi:DUF1404 domain-containing protein [Sulfurisphaera tokodaii]|uniref:DUF1404 domain-containing protein n=2 Tax=Sulfurisphaera tokodaii TaxID=111955 RepID=Q976T7_SULTO|nr:DUF1404 family protein [Sulfurisphaera tokodaii]BAB65059.1 hypothetical protein STK_01020 [Sulfurisphaera tokodaii str. 7]HII74144.1 DUF1404 domain-containing protein [Sulfurisphaera tokodaii]